MPYRLNLTRAFAAIARLGAGRQREFASRVQLGLPRWAKMGETEGLVEIAALLADFFPGDVVNGMDQLIDVEPTPRGDAEAAARSVGFNHLSEPVEADGPAGHNPYDVPATAIREEEILAEQVKTLEAVARKVDGRIYEGYSGRGMFGDICYGIVCSDPTACIEEAAKAGITGAKKDSMGRDYIVYWPKIG